MSPEQRERRGLNRTREKLEGGERKDRAQRRATGMRRKKSPNSRVVRRDGAACRRGQSPSWEEVRIQGRPEELRRARMPA